MRRFLFFIFFIMLFSGCNPKPISSAIDELTLHYIDNKIYDPTICEAKEINGSYYILCHQSGNKNSGGLYKIEYDSSDKYVIRPVNGKAMQHAGQSFGDTLKDNNTDICKIIESF